MLHSHQRTRCWSAKGSSGKVCRKLPYFYTTTRTTVLPDYYYYPGFYRFGYFRGGVWRHHHHFYSFWLYSYSFDPYPDIVSYEVPYKIVYFEGDRCTGWEYLNY